MDSQDNYYDHYKDSFDLLKGYLKKRDIFTVVILILAAILFLQIQSPNDAEHVATSIIQNYINDLSINFKYVNSILIFTYLWIVMQYYQIVLLIERNYTYIHKLEKTLSEDGVFLIQREGVNYLQSYPWMKSFVNIIYKLLFPIMIAVVAIFKFIIELKNKYDFIVFDSIILALVLILTVLYLSNRFFNEEFFSKDKYPQMKWYWRIRKYISGNNQ